jgi:mono/diheme cytochrome c family protein/DNA-binding beta-propeller fold protein YncE
MNLPFARIRSLGLLALSTLCGLTHAQANEGQPLILYQQHCAVCHGEGRLGGMGPALLPENLGRLRKAEATGVITQGRVATQMQGFGDRLKGEEIQALVDYIYTPLAELPHWDITASRDSQVIHHRLDTLSTSPTFKADMLNLFVVVELGDHHFTLLDGDSFEPIGRFPTRFALHGGPKYSPDGRFVYFASRDGWIAKFDIYNQKWVAEIRAGINTRNIAVSGDGRYVMVANYLPHTLVLLDAEYLTPIKQYEVKDSHGQSSRVSAVYTARPRNSFVAALKDVPELWEISYADEPPPGFSGWEHSYNEESGDLVKGERFPLLRIPVADNLDDFFFNQEYDLLLGASREGKGMVVSLDVKRVIQTLDLPGMPHLGSGITWEYKGRKVMATPNLKEGVVSIIDMESWQTIKRIETLGPGFFMRSHDNSPYAWVDVFFGPNKDAVHVIDKQTLEIVKTLRPAPGKTAAHVEFTRDGKYALLSIWEMEGAVVVYDATTLQEVKRLPMKKPSGKYNVWNKTRYEGGTSH